MNIQHVIDLLNRAELYDESSAVLVMVEQNKELLDALKEMCALYNTDEGTRSLPQYIAAVQSISKAEATSIQLSKEWK